LWKVHVIYHSYLLCLKSARIAWTITSIYLKVISKTSQTNFVKQYTGSMTH